MNPSAGKQRVPTSRISTQQARAASGRRRSDREPSTEKLHEVQRVSTTARAVVTERDRLIRAARADGASWTELSDASGLSRSGVRRVCERSDPPGS